LFLSVFQIFHFQFSIRPFYAPFITAQTALHLGGAVFHLT